MDETRLITRIISFPRGMHNDLLQYCSARGLKESVFIRAAVLYAMENLRSADVAALVAQEYDKYRDNVQQ